MPAGPVEREVRAHWLRLGKSFPRSFHGSVVLVNSSVKVLIAEVPNGPDARKRAQDVKKAFHNFRLVTRKSVLRIYLVEDAPPIR